MVITYKKKVNFAKILKTSKKIFKYINLNRGSSLKNCIILFIFFSSCTCTRATITEDFIDRKEKTGKQIMKEMSAPDPLQTPVYGPLIKRNLCSFFSEN